VTIARINFDIFPVDFPDFFDGWGDQQFTHAMRDGVKAATERCLRNALGHAILKLRIDDNITTQVVDGYNYLGIDLKLIQDTGEFMVHGLRFDVDLGHEDAVEQWEFVTGANVAFEHWVPNVSPAPVVTDKPMRRCRRYKINVPRLRVQSDAVGIDPDIIERCTCAPKTLKPVNNPYPLLTFRCFVCGRRYLCECFRGIAEKQVQRPNFDHSNHQRLLDTTPYKPEICHLCQGVPSTTGIRQQNESEVRAFYRPYVHAFAQKLDFDWRAAENHVRDRLRVPRIGEGWLAEATLLRIVQGLFPEHEVIHQASPDWLGRQRFDIFIPALKLAIEYNGEQHYFPIERFGGERALATTQQRDQEKREKAREAGVTLIEFRYDDEMTAELVRTRIDRHSHPLHRLPSIRPPSSSGRKSPR
jgi:hypothetical protein